MRTSFRHKSSAGSAIKELRRPTGENMPMNYQIKRHGKTVESHHTLKAAETAFWILTAHELKNGRTADYELDTRSSLGVTPPEEMAGLIPSWAKQVLREHGVMS